MGSGLKLAAQALTLVLIAGLLGLLAWKVTHQEGGKLIERIAENERPSAPNFTLSRLDRSGDLELNALRGKVVLLNFWATWCDPCQRELPRLQRAWRRYRANDDRRKIVFVGINTQDFDNDARRTIERFEMTFPNVYDGAGRVLARYGGLPLPKTFVVDRQGRIVASHYGELEDPDIARLLGSVGQPT